MPTEYDYDRECEEIDEALIQNFIIIKRSGDIDIEIPDGKYHVVADITIKDGDIKYIDDGVWTPCINFTNKEKQDE